MSEPTPATPGDKKGAPQGAVRPRPLSPHLQTYRLPLSAITSILHRMTGVALSIGAFVFVAWLWSVATRVQCFEAGPDVNLQCFERIQSVFASPLGMLALAGWAFALYYHLCAGIRHLFWDAGVGFEKASYRFTNWVVIGASLVMTCCTVLMFREKYLAAFGLSA